MRVVLAIVGAVGLLATGGCGDTASRPVAAQASSTSTPSGTPTTAAEQGRPLSSPAAPARLTVAQARTRYLAVTRPYNIALERFEKAANSGASVPTLRARARSVAAANLAESRLLLSTRWPVNVMAQVQELARADAAARKYWLRVAAADSLAEMAAHLRRASAAGGKAPAAEIRRLLGLPKYDESDYS